MKKPDLRTWFEEIKSSLPNLPFKKSERNDLLREEILARVVGEFLTDDERAAFFGLPEGCRIREGAKIISPQNLVMGEHCWVGENAVLDASGGLRIGAHTSIGLSVFVWSHSSHIANLKMSNTPGNEYISRKGTSIGSGCFISGPAVIMPGVTIGNSVLIRPFSTVDCDVPERSLVTPNGIKSGVFTEKMIEKMARGVA